MIAPGGKVYLRACRAGEPGTVIREERAKLTVYGADMDFWSKHRPEYARILSNSRSTSPRDSE